MGKLISVSIVTHDEIVFEGQGRKVSIPAADGYMEFMDRHAPLITPLGIGIVTLTARTGEEQTFFVSGGYAEIHENKMIVLADTAESSDRIDIERALKAKERALKRILDAGAGKWDIERAQIALARALSRLKTNKNIKKGPLT